MTSQAGQTGQTGLCERCAYRTLVLSRRGNRFHLCGKSNDDPSFPKYPRLPVLQCAGFVSADSGNGRHNNAKDQ